MRRGMKTARDVVKQLEGLVGRAGERLTGHVAEPSSTARDVAETRALRRALAAGFANRLARRLPSHNGYRTLGDRSVLAALHPSNARVAATGHRGGGGLGPEWVVYHELRSTSKAYLLKVCPVEEAWVAGAIDRSRACDLGRLSGGRALSIAPPDASPDPLAITRIHTKKRGAQAVERANSVSEVDAARARYLARKKLKAEAQAGKKK